MKFLDEIGLSHFITKLKEMFNSKVDKVSGKQLSTEDYSTIEKNKLNGIETGANKYTHPSTHPYSMITGTPTSLPASGGQSTTTKHLVGDDTRSVNSPPSVYMSSGSRWAGRAGWQTEFKYRSTIGSPSSLSGTYVYLQTHTPWSDPSGGYPVQIAYGNGAPSWRVGVSNSTWSGWESFNDNGNAATVDGKTVGVSVPANANFNNTTYTAGANMSLDGTVFSAVDTPQRGIDTTPTTSTIKSISSSWANTHSAAKGNNAHVPAAGSAGQFLAHNGTWTTPPKGSVVAQTKPSDGTEMWYEEVL